MPQRGDILLALGFIFGPYDFLLLGQDEREHMQCQLAREAAEVVPTR
jgi:hypothetical protein